MGSYVFRPFWGRKPTHNCHWQSANLKDDYQGYSCGYIQCACPVTSTYTGVDVSTLSDSQAGAMCIRIQSSGLPE